MEHRNQKTKNEVVRTCDEITRANSCKKSIQYANEKYVRPRARPPTSWLSMMKKQLINDQKLTWLEACDIAKDRIIWNKYSK